MDNYRIDGHKLLYHIPRVNAWLNKENIYPIYMEISPTGACNHRCTFCGLDFMKYQRRFLDTGLLKERLSEMGRLGLKGVMYSGEGEPFLHKEISDLILHTKESSIDVALTTNGVLLNESTAEKILGHVEWIKVSISAATKETYAKIHKTESDDFDKVVKNLSNAANIIKVKGYKCALGMQILLLPENSHEILQLAEIAREIGMNYLVVKPYSQHLLSKTNRYKQIKYNDYLYIADELKKFKTNHFSVIFRINTMKKWDESKRNYERCFALPFWSYIDSGGNVWGCSAYLGDKKFLYGNIYENSFKEIWESEKRKKSLHWVEEELDVSNCRINCRMDEINRYLWKLTYEPPEHVNFI
ncbi:MAG TPA: radical SAM protein [Nitrospinota bacterium]|nr:radical SAM protein [Nitrospinota bacterium]